MFMQSEMFETNIVEMSGTHLSAYLNGFQNSETEGIDSVGIVTLCMHVHLLSSFIRLGLRSGLLKKMWIRHLYSKEIGHQND